MFTSKKIIILCTLGPSSLNKTFLEFANKNVNLLRINLSHVSLKTLPGLIKKIRLYSKVPICIDTEGAQIRTKIKKKEIFKEKIHQLKFSEKIMNSHYIHLKYSIS